jgi:phospholipase D1/2
MELNSGVKFGEAQVALARQWVAGDALTTQREIVLALPRDLEEAPLEVSTEKEKEKEKLSTFKVAIPADIETARQIVVNFQNGALSERSDEPVADNVAQHRFQDQTSLLQEKWLGTEEEELNAWVFRLSFVSVAFTDCTELFFLVSYVSELVYIHSKVMIVDDRRVIVTILYIYMLSILPSILTLDHRWDRRTSTIVVKRCDYNDARLSRFLILTTSG